MLFNSAAFNCTVYVTWINRMSSNHLERVWKEAVVTYFKVLPQDLPGATEENLKRLPNRHTNSGPSELETGLLTHYTAAFRVLTEFWLVS
jgi:hypothetical protein